MKLFSIGKLDKKLFIFLLISIITEISLSLVNYCFTDNDKDTINNVFLKNIISTGSYIFFIFPLFITKCSSKRKHESKDNDKIIRKFSYIYNSPIKLQKSRNLIIATSLIMLYFIYPIFCNIFVATNKEHLKYGSNEYYSVIDIFYLYLIFKFKHKIIFYKHQYLSMILMVIMEIIRYFSKIFKNIKEASFDFPKDLLYLVPIILFPLVDALKNYSLKYFLQHFYFSEYFIGFLVGIIYTFFSVILLIIFFNINCEGWEICPCFLLSENKSISGFAIILYIFYSIFNSTCFLSRIFVMSNFTVFHLIIIFSCNTMITSVFELIQDYTLFELIIMIITFFIEIISIFAFLEIIECNFCGLNRNLKRNIINRAKEEANLYLDTNNNDSGLEIREDLPEDIGNLINDENDYYYFP